MNRGLHITIHERADASPRRATAYLPGRSDSEPGTNYVMPPPDSTDPGTNYVMPPPDSTDPGTNLVMPPPDNQRLAQGSYSSAGDIDTVVTVRTCDCATPAGPQPASTAGTTVPNPFVRPRDYSGFVIVRTAEGVVSTGSLAESLWTLAQEHTPKLSGLTAVLELALTAEKADEKPKPETEALGAGRSPKGGRSKESKELAGPPVGVLFSRPLVELQGDCGEPLSRSACLALLRELEKKTATTAFPPLHSLTAYWRVDLRDHPDLVEKVVTGLNRLAEVDLAYRELAATDPQIAAAGQLFAEDQGYLDDAPVGISAAWAWKSLAATPSQLTVCDLEQGWNPGHQDLKDAQGRPLVLPDVVYGANRAQDEGTPGHHGTAVLGQLAAAGQSAYGVKGAATDLGRFLLASHYRARTERFFPGTSGHVAAAIVQALSPPASSSLVNVVPLQAGDVLLLEIQRALLPAEVDEADLDAIRLASGHGVLVVEAAGNGGFDLDGYADPDTGRSLNRASPYFRDSGAILVGAARADLPHDRAPFSNYGSRLDCFGWGEAVTTCGFGDLSGTVAANYYTNSFNGTSSASPIIAGAAALVQALHKDHAGSWLTPLALRALLADPATGTRQGPNVPGFIGVMPDLKAVVRGRLQLVPDVYMRRRIGDDGSAPGPGEDISSSPDILVWDGKSQLADNRFGEGPRANTPAPGTPIDPGDPNAIYPSNLYVRLRNRGSGEDTATVQLFASPAATLITPERWMPIGSVQVPKIVQGDTLAVSPPVALDLPTAWAQDASKWPPGALPASVVPAYSFLAVQLPEDETSSYAAPGYERDYGLPPGGQYFDWAKFRSFLRGRGVTWRNVHPVRPAAGMTLAFLLAGTPDQARYFDFEVIQRLPAGAQVTLKVPEALAAKLHQRQPGLANGGGNLSLPHRPRTTLSQVALAQGFCAHAAFRVQVGSKPLLRGHSLAIRQIWRGEEVGRITWWFVDPASA